MNHEKVNILGSLVSAINRPELKKYFCEVIEQNRKEAILCTNIYGLNLCYEHEWLKNFMNSVPVLYSDGDGVTLAAKIIGKRVGEKITYNSWIWELAELSQREGFSWYIVGSREGTAYKAVKNLKVKYPKLNIVGYRSGYFSSETDLRNTINDIIDKKPNILFISLGMPLQERWIHDHINEVQTNILLNSGAAFEYVAGLAKMTPPVFSKLKIEWFYRYLQDPKRLFFRYFIGNPLFFIRLIKYHLLGI